MPRMRRFSRRRLLKAATGAAVGVASGPQLVPSSALGFGAQRPPSERIGLAFIGPGGRGTQLVRELVSRSDVEPLAVSDVIRARREKVKAIIEADLAERRSRGTYQGCRAYVDFRDVLARPDVDGVVLSAPEHWRPIMCIMACKAGKDVLAEKPFALTIKEGQAMVEAIRRYGRVFQHGTQRRSNNEQNLRDSCEMVRSGRIGKVTHAVVTVGPSPRPDFPDYTARHRLPDRNEFDWDLWLGPAAWRPFPGGIGVGHWQGMRDFGLGSIGNWGSHVLDMAQWALGKDEEGPVEILPPEADRPLTLRYADGVEIRVPRTPGDSANTAVYGTEGQKIIFGGPKIREKYHLKPLGPGDVFLYRPEGNDHNGDWLRHMRDRKKTICNEEVAYRSGSLCMLIALADRLQRPLKYDPVRAEFPGDDEANRLLDTPKRSPWQVY